MMKSVINPSAWLVSWHVALVWWGITAQCCFDFLQLTAALCQRKAVIATGHTHGDYLLQ